MQGSGRQRLEHFRDWPMTGRGGGKTPGVRVLEARATRGFPVCAPEPATHFADALAFFSSLSLSLSLARTHSR